MFIECKNLVYQYIDSGKLIFNGLDIWFNRPGFHAIFGPSGVGKTSLARIFTGDVKAQSGKVISKTGCVLLYSHNMERLPDWSGVGRHLDRVTPSHNKQLKSRLMKDFGLDHLSQHRFSSLSMGQQNRINLIRYLVQDFNILIMDECLANVDEKTRQQILLLIKQLFPSRIFIYISHHLAEVSTYCKDVWILRDASKTPQVVRVDGMDLLTDEKHDSTQLNTTMLEIINNV